MKLFIDSADIDEIRSVKDYGILDGVTTNPSLIKKASEKHKIKSMEYYIKQILKLCKGIPVSLEVIGNTYDDMLNEALLLYKKFNPVAKNVYVKIPVNPCFSLICDNDMDGIKVIKQLSKKKIPVNCTLIFTPEQAILAAKAGAKIVSPFSGRVDDFLRANAKIKFEKTDYYPAGGLKKGKKILNDKGITSGVDLIKKIRIIFDNGKIKSEILAASIRNKREFREVALVGADIATVPFKVIQNLNKHKKSVEGMKKFTKDIVPEYMSLLHPKKRTK